MTIKVRYHRKVGWQSLEKKMTFLGKWVTFQSIDFKFEILGMESA